MATLDRVQIFPSIGIARIGNSPDWFFGPELPDPAPAPLPPGGTYKDEQCRIKRQAQRFRLWGFYSDNTDRELTLADGDISWTVHLANAKPTVTSEGIIDGGLQTLDGAGTNKAFVGSFAGVSVPLGEAHTDSEGRLIVLGGYGKSENPTDPNSAPSFPTTAGWYDDVADGPITATITIDGTSYDAQHGAWVICPPPRFAPTTYAITSLYDTLRQLAISKNQLPQPVSAGVHQRRLSDPAASARHALGDGVHLQRRRSRYARGLRSSRRSRRHARQPSRRLLAAQARGQHAASEQWRELVPACRFPAQFHAAVEQRTDQRGLAAFDSRHDHAGRPHASGS
jgi:hypothetical protein